MLNVHKNNFHEDEKVTHNSDKETFNPSECELKNCTMHFFERSYKMLSEFCEKEGGGVISEIHVIHVINELTLNNQRRDPIQMPEDFINHEKLGIWLRLKEKVSDRQQQKLL